jgi:YbbR domain-containing protein
MHWIRRLITHNWFLKLFSVLLAALLWLTIAGETNSVINRTVALEFQGIPPNMEITGETATEVNLQLRGSSSVLNGISPADVAAVISLSGQPPGSKTVALTSANVETPFGVEVLRIDPVRVQFDLERTLTRTLQVRPVVEGEPAQDYEVVAYSVTPSTVTVVGPESNVRPLESLPTFSIRIDGAQGNVRTSADLNVLDPLVRLESLSPHEVEVEIREVQEEGFYTATLDPTLEDPSRWLVEPSAIEVTVQGPKSLMADFDPGDLYFTFDTSVLSPGNQQVTPEVALEEPYSVVLTDPETVAVTLRE